MKRIKLRRLLGLVGAYGIFFLMIAVPVTVCFLLFLQDSGLSEEVIRARAPVTFGNVALLSLLCTVVDALRQEFTIRRPVRRILEGTRRIRQGDFTTRIRPVHTGRRQNEYDQIITDLNLMAAELGSIETLRTDFIANVSHELKAPLAVIQNYATLLRQPTLPPAQQQAYAAAITAAARRLTDLITNILRLNKLENQQIFLQPTTFDLSDQLRGCLLDCEDAWTAKGLQLVTELPDDVHIRGDAELLALVWNNLLSNAIKFTDPGGTLTVRLRPLAETVEVSVADTGCGIPPEVGQRMFEKFYQGDPSHAAQGNGLGLALVKRVIDIIHGTIRVESTVGQGSVFTVVLPREAKP